MTEREYQRLARRRDELIANGVDPRLLDRPRMVVRPYQGWQARPPRRIDWWRVWGALSIVLSGIGMATILWLLWLLWATFLSVGG